MGFVTASLHYLVFKHSLFCWRPLMRWTRCFAHLHKQSMSIIWMLS